MLGHFETLLEGIVADPDRRLSELPLLTGAERQQLLVEWNRTEAPYPKDWCLHELFEEQVERTPDATAVVFEDRRLTYRQLNQRANQLARYLQKLGVGPDALVAICVERSLEMVVGLLGILKAGGAYVPLDPDYPKERLGFMLADTGSPILLTQSGLQQRLPSHGALILLLDLDWPLIARETADNVISPVKAEHLAYMIYTSGSTGRPKGVMIPHQAIVNHLWWMQASFPLDSTDSILQKYAISFDPSVWECFAPLVAGARLVVARSGGQADPDYLIHTIVNQGITALQLVPSQLRMLLDASGFGTCTTLRRIFVGGEAFDGDLAARFHGSMKAELYNLYGPTEATIASTFFFAPYDPGMDAVPIGRPIANTELYVVDIWGQPVPIGVPGELLIGGDGLARGYHNRPDLTAEKFVPDAFRSEAGARLYKTGDLARYLPNGAIEYLGRLDHQVKIRGFRIELGEIELVLGGFPGVREAVVLAREDAPGEKRLVAYFCGEGDIAATDFRAHLEAALPEYMVPAAYVRLDALPLTPNGKLDRRALPAPGDHAFGAQAYEAPTGPIETAIAAIWAEFLHLERVGRHDDFFNLGGHSMMALRVIGAINKALKAGLRVPVFFQSPTVERLAKVVEQRHHNGHESNVIKLQPGHAGLPLYIIGARPEECRLAQSLGEDRAIFAIDPPMPVEWHRAITAADQAARPTMEELGALYGDVLRAHAGSSPCVIVGYSLGGMIAFEAAHALQRAGGNVGLVLLVDAGAMFLSGATRGPLWQSLRSIWRNAASGTPSDFSFLARLSASLADSWRLFLWLKARIPKMLKGRLQSAKKYFSPEARPSGYLNKQGVPIDQTVIDRLVRVAARAWRPRPLDASGVLFRAKAPNEELLTGYDFSRGWRTLFDRGLEVVQASGDHWSMVGDANLPALARQINSVLDQYEAEHNADTVKTDDETDAGRSAGQSRSGRELPQIEKVVI